MELLLTDIIFFFFRNYQFNFQKHFLENEVVKFTNDVLRVYYIYTRLILFQELFCWLRSVDLIWLRMIVLYFNEDTNAICSGYDAVEVVFHCRPEQAGAHQFTCLSSCWADRCLWLISMVNDITYLFVLYYSQLKSAPN